MKDCGTSQNCRPPGGFACAYVFPDDAEDIKAHRWFRNFK
jgi:hypothetical protein